LQTKGWVDRDRAARQENFAATSGDNGAGHEILLHRRRKEMQSTLEMQHAVVPCLNVEISCCIVSGLCITPRYFAALQMNLPQCLGTLIQCLQTMQHRALRCSIIARGCGIELYDAALSPDIAAQSADDAAA
jgi:hypothetical protein